MLDGKASELPMETARSNGRSSSHPLKNCFIPVVRCWPAHDHGLGVPLISALKAIGFLVRPLDDRSPQVRLPKDEGNILKLTCPQPTIISIFKTQVPSPFLGN